ncbi:MAG: AAA family ATPase, partial [bacterium]|nr:AAA family ATPase [bacterium]
MGLAEQIDQLLADFQERQVPKVTPRSLVLPGLPGKADVVVGMRRSGKSYFLYQDIQEKLRSGVDRERILYLNLEDERLLPLDVQELRLIPEAFYRRCPANKDR